MPRPTRLVLLGHPVGHSLSPRIQNAALRSAGIPLDYTALDVRPDELVSTLERLTREGAGGNVTIPHKVAVAARASLTPLAERTGAVNTFWVEDGGLRGDNTDVGGFDATVRTLLGGLPAGPIAVLGAGGAAAAILAAVERWDGIHARVVGRSPDRVALLCARFPGVATPVMSVGDALSGASLVVNATPIGLTNDAHPVSLELVPRSAAVIDLVYRVGGTPWTRAATQRGHIASDGLAMLVEQAALAFERWFGVAADRAAMWRSLD